MVNEYVNNILVVFAGNKMNIKAPDTANISEPGFIFLSNL